MIIYGLVYAICMKFYGIRHSLLIINSRSLRIPYLSNNQDDFLIVSPVAREAMILVR